MTSKPRKNLSGEFLYQECKQFFKSIPDSRNSSSKIIPLDDALMSGLAIFALKYPSLFHFDNMSKEEPALAQNLKNIFNINNIPSDTHLRDLLDPIDPENIRPLFKKIFSNLQRGKVLEEFKYFEDTFLISVDGTGHFHSSKINCPHCLEKVSKETGEVSYHHQLLGASLVCPNKDTVFPFRPEPIRKEDGFSKNDCEMNACKRLLLKLREDHPRLNITILLDSLYANASHIKELMKLQMGYIINVKPSKNPSLYEFIGAREAKIGDVQEHSVEEIIGDKIKKKVVHNFKYLNEVPLNKANTNLSVNYLGYTETTTWTDRKGVNRRKVKKFSWVTDRHLTKNNITKISIAGRSRWKIENESFNTLKNQGYHFEHNFGHGKKNLSTNFSFLMMLAFLIDQIQQTCCPVFRKGFYKRSYTRKTFWDKFIHYMYDIVVENYTQVLQLISKEIRLLLNTS